MPAVKAKEKKNKKQYTSLRIDIETHARLKQAAGDVPLSRYLRELSTSLSGEIKDPIAEKLDGIVFTLQELKDSFMLYRENKEGRIVPVEDMVEADGTPIPLIPASLIQDELEKNPNCRKVGWYLRNDDGSWSFDQSGYDEYIKQEELERAGQDKKELIRELAKKLNCSEKRMQLLEIFLKNGSSSIIDYIYKDLSNRIADGGAFYSDYEWRKLLNDINKQRESINEA